MSKAPTKRTRSIQKHFKGITHTTQTISSPPFSYIHLCLTTTSKPQSTTTPNPQIQNQNENTQSVPKTSTDTLTLRAHLTTALIQFLGLSGSAISVDILKVDERTGELWVRVPREDAGVFVAAVGAWVGGKGSAEEKVGWRVRGRGNWLSAVNGGDGEDGVWND